MDADYPAIGIKMTNLPDSTKNLGIGERLSGYEAEISLAQGTTIRILRLDEPAPEGNMGDNGYRDALLKQFGIPATGGGIHGVTNVSGRAAWVLGSVQRLGPMLAYQCSYYLVVGKHLDEIMISAMGESKMARASFDAAAQVIASDLIFEPVQRPPEEPLAPGERPSFLMGETVGEYYPDRARRLGEQGDVDFEFNIDGEGKAQAIKVVGNATSDLDTIALSMLKGGGFKIPRTWKQSGGPKQMFRMEFRFHLSCPAASQSSADPDPRVVTICGSVLPH